MPETTNQRPRGKKKIAVYPGSFDPMTLGHVDIIGRIAEIFDEVIVLIAQNIDKQCMFTAEERQALVRASLEDLPQVRVEVWSGLTVDFLRQIDSHVLVRGLRTVSDFDLESAMAQMNQHLYPCSETLLVFANPKYQAISSRMVKEVARLGGPLTGIVPESVERAIQKKFPKRK